MIRTYSQTEAARRDTVHTQADGYALDRLSTLFYGVTRPANFPRSTWSNVLTAWAYAPRCTMQGTWAVIDAMFRPYANLLTLTNVTIAAHPTLSDQYVRASHSDFSDAYSQRLAIIDDGEKETLVFMAIADTGYADISRISSGHWSGYSDTGTVTLTPLPYWIEEKVGEVVLWLDGELMGAPPTYMQQQSYTRPANQPLGGILLNLFDLDPATLDYGDQVDGPFPIYLGAEELSGVFGHILKRTLPAGIRISARVHNWAGQLGTGSFGSIINTGGIGQP